ncbi:hypothetical protein GMC01_15465 [Turicibacter sanguinis]|nr:hypothetical protein [Turicibacter sanguinis]
MKRYDFFKIGSLMKISRRKSKLNRQRYIQIPLLNTNKVSEIKWAECYLAMERLFRKLGINDRKLWSATYATDDSLLPEAPKNMWLGYYKWLNYFYGSGIYIVNPIRELPQHLGETQYIARITEREDKKFDFYFSNDEKVTLDNLDDVEFVGKVQIFKTEEELIPFWFKQKDQFSFLK